MAQPAGDARQAFAAREHDAIDVRVLERDARRLEARGAMGPERLVQPRAPAERL